MSNAPSDEAQLRKLEEALKEKPPEVQHPALLDFPAAPAGAPSLTRVAPPGDPQIPPTPEGVKVHLDEEREEPKTSQDVLERILERLESLPQDIRAALED